MGARIEWRGALAVYVGAYAIVTAFSLAASLWSVRLAVARPVYYAAVFVLFWLVARELLARAAVASAAMGTLLTLLLNSASRSLGLDLGTLGNNDTRPVLLWISGIGVAVLVALLIGWAVRDRRWKALTAIATIELIASVGVVVAGDRLWTGPTWILPMIALATSWDAALRILVAWAISLVAFRWGVAGGTSQVRTVPDDEAPIA